MQQTCHREQSPSWCWKRPYGWLTVPPPCF